MEKMKPRILRSVEDKQVILKNIREKGPISRSTIHQITGLRLASITYGVRELLSEGLIQEIKKVKLHTGRAGRNHILLDLNPDARYAIGVELKYGSIYLLLLNLKGNLIKKKEVRYQIGLEKFQILNLLQKAITEFVKEVKIPLKRVVGLGFVDPGLVDVKRGMSLFSTFLSGWKDVPTKHFLEEALKIPVHLVGTSQARAIAESIYGAGKGCNDFLCVEYGQGIACGIVSGGHLVRGALETAGELGHCHFPENKTPCHCGGFGCLEAICALPALARKAKMLMKLGAETILLKSTGGLPEKVTGLMILDGFQKNDRLCQQILEEAAYYLGAAIANAVNLFNPELVIFDQTLARAGEYFLEHLKHIIRRESLPGGEYLKFAISRLGEEAGSLGGATLALDDFFVRYGREGSYEEKAATDGELDC